MKKSNILKMLCMLILVLAFIVGQIPPVAQVAYAEDGTPVVEIDNCGSRLNAKVKNIDNPSYQWEISSTEDGTYSSISGATGAHYDITSGDEGKFIRLKVGDKTSTPTGPIGKLVVFDLYRGAIKLGTTYSGIDMNGNTISDTHAASNIYVVKQSNKNIEDEPTESNRTSNNIVFSGNLPNSPFDLTLDGVNMGATPTNHNQNPGTSGSATPTGGQITIPAASSAVKHVTIRLKGENVVRNITYYNGGDTQTPATVQSSLKFTDVNGDGASDGGSLYVPIKLNADEIEAFVNTKTNYNHWNAGIGGYDSSSLVQNLTIAGGRIQVATTLGDNCTAIGAGGNGYCDMEITGGEVYAYCNGTGAAIGGGIGWNAKGGPADVLISGGKVYAKNYAEIETTKDGQEAIVGGVAIGAGSSFFADGSYGNVTITGGIVEAYGTFGNGIGGGNSSTGIGGAANIDISGGTVTATSIGGGNSKKGKGGDADVDVSGAAKVTLTKGIGGGLSESGNGGDATINVYGGTMTAGGTNPCYFNMSGGTLYGVNTADNSKYTYAQQNGAAVYMDDPDGTVNITGGVIENCHAENGGAIYMTAGKFTMSQADGDVQAIIRNCTATGNGGAVYLGGGTVTITGGTINNNNAGESGGAVYVNGGNVRVEGGTLSNNTAASNGGAVDINNGNYTMIGGTVSGNTATNGAGGGIYVAAETDAVNVDIRSGTISNNRSESHGGAVAVVGKNDESAKPITVTVGVNKIHYNEEGAQLTNCEHGDNMQQRYTCPVLSGNATNGSGGAIYLTGNYDSKLYLYCCEEDKEHESYAGLDNGQSNFMKVEGGKVVITASQIMSESDLNSQDAKHGNVKIQSTVYITGGQVDLWGDMQNPSFDEIITVDVTKEGDYFEDHRLFDVYYKLTYYENFKDPVTGQVTGQYKETKVKKGEKETISANIYEHPGYKIVGWNTDRFGSTEGTWYEPGKEYTFDGAPIGDLTIYAIWEANGYDVIFNPNVPEGEKYSGVMANQSLTYDAWAELMPNAYKRPGYIFSGWSTTSTGAVEYEDKASVKNLTTQIGVPVELFAIWSKCNHVITEHKYTYSVIDDGKTLKRECECEGHSETAELQAEDTVYDESEHPASVTYPSGWQGDKPAIMYKKEDTVLSGAPKNAGTYTANISASGKTASVTYIIEKAPQSAPDKPVYDTNGKNGDTIMVHPVDVKITDDPTYDSKVLYKVVYYDSNNEKKEQKVIWNPYENTLIDGKYAAVFDLDIALTNYYVYASYTEGTNYKASDETMADGVYWFTGNIKVIVNSGEGIVHTLKEATAGSGLTGINLKLELEDGYYLPSGHAVTVDTKKQDNSAFDGAGAEIKKATSNGLEYNIESIPAECLLIITINDAVKAPFVSAKIEEDEVFGTVRGNEARISRDSAYTAYFEVKDYDTGAYDGITLEFNSNDEPVDLPVGTTLIMVDKTAGSNEYYKYIVKTKSDAVKLTWFTEMGGETVYSLSSGNKDLQFIVDFSDVAADEYISSSVDNLKTKLKLNKKDGSGASDIEADVVLKLEDVSGFHMATQGESSQTVVLDLEYTASIGTASKWNDRNSAIVLVPETPIIGLENNIIPQDARIKCYDGVSTRIIDRNRAGNFIIPLDVLASKNLTLTMESSTLAPYATYKMNANWIVAESLAGSAPTNGEWVVENVAVQFDMGSMSVPSIKIVPTDNNGNDRLYTVDETLNVNVMWSNLNIEDKVVVELLKKGPTGEYIDTAVGANNLNTGVPKTTVPFSTGLNLAVNDPAKYQSYCLRVRVMDGLVKTAETNYYFIVEKTET